MEERRKEIYDLLEDLLGPYGFSSEMAYALRFFLRNPYESIVVTDKKARFVFLDRGSEKFFGLPEGGAKGMKVSELIPETCVPDVIKTVVPLIGRVFQVNGVTRVGSTFPLVRDGKVVGAVGRILFRYVEEVERVNREVRSLRREVESLREMQRRNHSVLYTFESILGKSQILRESIEMAKKVALIDSDVLITGESGTGKELFAQAIHNYKGSDRSFVRVNSPAIPFELAESELFGYEKGAFSGANSMGKPGKFELANGGTLFLDEISSLPLSIQAKLLRVLQEREVERLGAIRIQNVDFKLIAATNVDLKRLVKEGKFREDLYYRVAKATIRIPPLRDRREDILVYVNHYLKTINERFTTGFKRLSEEALLCFFQYQWPGNVRELINVLEQAALKKWEGEEIDGRCLPAELLNRSPGLQRTGKAEGFRTEVRKQEYELVRSAMEQTRGNKRKAAFLLAMPRSTLYKKLREYGLDGARE